MAKYYPIYKRSIVREGGFILERVKGDRGGLTFAGITRVNWPNWEGWPLVLAGDRNSHELRVMVANFYIRNFWRPIHGSKIIDERIAETIFDFGVNTGVRPSVELAQAACGAKVDGKIGPKTLAKLNAMSYETFSLAFALSKVLRYAKICNADETQHRFLLGWINRIFRVRGEMR